MRNPAVDDAVRLSCQSRPFYQRPAFVPTLVTVSGVWLTVALLCVSALHKVDSYGAVALLLGLSAAMIAAFLGRFTYRWLMEMSRTHTLEFSDRAVTYKIRQKLLRGKTTSINMPYSQLEHVDNFSSRSYANLVLHLKDGRVVAVPTWAMTLEPGPILALLLEKQVPIVHV